MSAPVIELLERSGIQDYTVHRVPNDALHVTVHERREDAQRVNAFRLWLRTAYSVSSDSTVPPGFSLLLPEPGADSGIDFMVRARVGGENVVFLFEAKHVDLPLSSADRSTYDGDFAVWARHQAGFIREGRWDHVDAENVAEEIDDLSRRQQHELRSRLRVLIMHVLKWEYQPECRSRSWAATIREQQTQIEDVVAMSPSLANVLPGYAEAVYDVARELAGLETGLPPSKFPVTLPYSVEHLLRIRPAFETEA